MYCVCKHPVMVAPDWRKIFYWRKILCLICGEKIRHAESEEVEEQEEDEQFEPVGDNHTELYVMLAGEHAYTVTCACPDCYTETQKRITNYWISDPAEQASTRSHLKKYRPRTDEIPFTY